MDSQYILYENESIGFTVEIPKSWVASTTKAVYSWEGDVLTLRSSEFSEKEYTYEDIIRTVSTTIPTSGASFSIPFKEESRVSEDISTPQLYSEWILSSNQKCSNCSGSQVVSLSGQPAVVYDIRGSVGTETSETTRIIKTLKDGREFRINYYAADGSTEQNQEIFRRFISTFTFTK